MGLTYVATFTDRNSPNVGIPYIDMDPKILGSKGG